MLTVRATLKDHHVEFDPTFTPPQAPVEVLVTFVEPSLPAATDSTEVTDMGARFSWDESLELTKDLGGIPVSLHLLEEREYDWR